MPVERSAGAVVFLREGRTLRYLLLHYKFKTEYWDFPRGKIEKGETPEQAALREVREETGLEAPLVPGFRHTIHWFYRREQKNYYKEVTYFLAEAPRKHVAINPREHLGHAWLPYEAALERATHKNTKEVLRKAHAFIKRLTPEACEQCARPAALAPRTIPSARLVQPIEGLRVRPPGFKLPRQSRSK
jgi:8-oxo-dGTP pyrophosphatase MutT (NUDIX family)